ncbi:hypothetical protein EV426DRAFT_687991 [Tirmania nivea]|nr:hypothetical protein EV426DRAFT_687991 [Tirmania nivea]
MSQQLQPENVNQLPNSPVDLQVERERLPVPSPIQNQKALSKRTAQGAGRSPTRRGHRGTKTSRAQRGGRWDKGAAISKETNPESKLQPELEGRHPSQKAYEHGLDAQRLIIPGNEKADKRTAYESALGRIAGSQQVATAAGIRAAAKARWKDMRSEPGFGANRTTGFTSSARSTPQPAPTAITPRRTATISTAPTTISNARSSSEMPGHRNIWTHQSGRKKRGRRRSGTR